ncbi:hypothetical protein INS49_015732 [Diaporthe citri]|uniref:uncharacterized protein n=1 Tax=Diaporthe citri TaxID=83186 RepID=UPI001C82290D|nr:uncharacterized protein INS49_015732 [Diaporthe citri]KAG6356344.1 hypothetical protein INS49_015732 [Diaporthe citri]
MVLSVLVAFGAVTGASEGIKASQAKARREEHRSRKNNLIVHVPKSSEYSQTLEGRRVVLSGNKLYVDTGLDNDVPFGHPFEGYFLGYPELNHPGLVSTISDEAPIMNWIYMDVQTFELKFGTRQFSEGNLTGPFDCTRQDRRLTLHGYENFVAVQNGPFWSLYFDWDGDHLEGRVPPGTAVVEIDLVRRELRNRKPRRKPGEQNPLAQDPQAATNPATNGAAPETGAPANPVPQT